VLVCVLAGLCLSAKVVESVPYPALLKELICDL